MRFDVRANLEEEKTKALLKIDEQANEVRGLFVTATATQALVYAEKEKEALSIVADAATPPAMTPHITAEATRLNVSRFDLSVEILTLANQWRQVSAVIESQRMGAKDAVRAALNIFELRQAADVDWSNIISLAQ